MMMYKALSALGIENEEFSFELRESYRDDHSLIQFIEEGGSFVVWWLRLGQILHQKM